MLAAALIVLGACSSPPATPTPLPTPTPIPGFVAGEEDLAYASFALHYEENCKKRIIDAGDETVEEIDKARVGRAVYIGDGMWRFHITLKKTAFGTTRETRWYHDTSWEDVAVVARSLTDGSWEDACPGPRVIDYWAEEHEAEEQYRHRYDYYDSLADPR